MITVQRLTIPSELPVTLAEAMNHTRVDYQGEAEAIEGMIAAATAELERLAEIAVLPQTIRVIFDGLASDDWQRLPIGPVLGEPLFEVTADGLPIDGDLLTGYRPRFRPLAPVSDLRHARVILDYQAGWASPPPDVRLAILDQVAVSYDQRAANAHTSDRASTGLGALAYAMQRVVGRYRGVTL